MGMQYRYFVELTEQVERLRVRLAERPGALAHDGLDLSHAFARQLYSAASYDAALYGLWSRSQGMTAPSNGALSCTAVALLARNWFGTALSPRWRLHAALAPARLLAGRGHATETIPGAAAPILLFAHSLRFARFLAPIAKRLGRRCAYLMAAADKASRQWAAEQGHAVRLYHPAPRQWRRSGAVLARYAPGLALLAEEIETALAQSGARVVLVPEGNAPVDEVVSQVGHRRGIATVCLQQGWSPLVHTGFRNMRYTQMLTWGQGFADLLAPCNPHQRFIPVGNMHLPETESRPAAGPHGVAFFCQGGGGWTSPGDQAHMVDLACRTAMALPALPVFVRPHPVAPLGAAACAKLAAIPNIQISDPVRQSLRDVLSQVSVGVSIYSSTILECLAAGVVPLIFNITTMPRYLPDIAAEGAAIEVKAPQEGFPALIDLLSNPESPRRFIPAMARLQPLYFPWCGGGALGRIVAEVDRLVEERRSGA